LIPFALLFSVLGGMGFALCARRQFSRGAQPWGRELVAVLSYELLLGWPVCLYFSWVFPDWSWLYFVDPHRLPVGTSLLVVLAAGSMLVGGFLIGWALLKTGRERILVGTLGGGGLLALILGILARHRLLAAGSYAEYHAGHAPSWTEAKLAWAIVITILATGAGVALVAMALLQEGTREARKPE
jgi:hypothetical protein